MAHHLSPVWGGMQNYNGVHVKQLGKAMEKNMPSDKYEQKELSRTIIKQ
jgi:hypothetical protein